MKESNVVPSPVVREITKHRLASNKLSKKPSMTRRSHVSSEKENIIEIPGLCGGRAPPPQVYQKPKYKLNRKELILPDIRNIRNPFSVIPIRDRYFYKEKVTRKPKKINYDIGPVKTVIDNIHHEFFSVIDGRPIRPNHDIKLYMRNLRDKFLLKADAAYLNDQSLKIETLYSGHEKEEYDRILEMYIKSVAGFQTCICHSFEMAQNAFLKQREIEEKVKAQNAELERRTFEYVKLKSLVLPMIEKFNVLQKYKKFLDVCPPLWWRLQNKVGYSGPSTAFKTFFLDSDESISITSETDDEYQFKQFESDEAMFDKPKVVLVKDTTCLLYFKEPVEMMNLLDDMAHYSYRYIQVGMQNSVAIKSISECIHSLKTKLSIEVQGVEFEIERFGDTIKYLEEKTEYVKAKFFRILKREFKKSVSSYDYLKLFVSLQYINTETLEAVSDPKDTLPMLMLQIERKYEQLMLALDNLDYEIVKNIISECMRDDREMMKKAYDAQRTLREWAVFEKALRACFDPPRYKYKRSL